MYRSPHAELCISFESLKASVAVRVCGEHTDERPLTETELGEDAVEEVDTVCVYHLSGSRAGNGGSFVGRRGEGGGTCRESKGEHGHTGKPRTQNAQESI